jgi:hypothetical protein
LIIMTFVILSVFRSELIHLCSHPILEYLVSRLASHCHAKGQSYRRISHCSRRSLARVSPDFHCPVCTTCNHLPRVYWVMLCPSDHLVMNFWRRIGLQNCSLSKRKHGNDIRELECLHQPSPKPKRHRLRLRIQPLLLHVQSMLGNDTMCDCGQ